jgi:tol-pal system protein YbgF
MPVALLVLVASLIATGCATRATTEELQEQVTAVRAAMTGLQAQVEGARALREDVNRLSTRIEALETRVAEASTHLARLDARVADAERDARDALTRVDALQSVVQKASLATVSVPAPPPPPRPSPAPVPAIVKPPQEERTGEPAVTASRRADYVFAAALSTFRSGEHGQAVLEFMDFIARYPKHPLGGNAQYWIGEAYYLQRDYRQSIVEFEKVLEHGLTHQSVPEALYRIGLANRNLKNRARATEVWRRLVRDYPKSQAAGRAREMLRTSATDATRR